MRYVDTVERSANAEAIIKVLEARFQQEPRELKVMMYAIQDEAQWDMLFQQAITINSLDEFKRSLEELTKDME